MEDRSVRSGRSRDVSVPPPVAVRDHAADGSDAGHVPRVGSRSADDSRNSASTSEHHETLQADIQHHLPGDVVHLTGHGYAPSSDVLMAVNLPDGTTTQASATSDAYGNLTYDFTLSDVTGDYSVQAESTDGAVSLATAPSRAGSLSRPTRPTTSLATP